LGEDEKTLEVPEDIPDDEQPLLALQSFSPYFFFQLLGSDFPSDFEIQGDN